MAIRGAVPAEISDLRERVERWRRSRRGHGAMPDELWAAAVAVARKRGLYVTARGVGVDYGALAKRVNAESQEGGSVSTVAFVEWSGAEILGPAAAPGGVVVEMSDASGRQVTVRLNGGEKADVPGIVAAFCGVRP